MVDAHVHQERFARLDRVLARREGRPAFDWDAWRDGTMARTPPGVARLRRLHSCFPVSAAADVEDETFIARVVDLLCDAGASGALLVEPRFGNETALRNDFFALFREAERRAQERYPALLAEPVVVFKLWQGDAETARLLKCCILAAGRGDLRGVDLLYEPYDTEADWRPAYRVAEALATAGARLTVHAGEFSGANIDAALRVPGVTRLGHATHADRRGIERLAAAGVVVESCPTSNVVLGAVGGIEAHPLPRLIEQGVPVVLGTDDPLALGTTIAREYALAARLGLDTAALLRITRTAIDAAFTSDDRRAALLQSPSFGVCDQISRAASS
jgi:hypothetical protein